MKTSIIETLIAINFLMLFSAQSINAQQTTKAEIKKQLDLAGQWRIESELSGGSKKDIETEYFYEFHKDGTYQFYFRSINDKQSADGTFRDVCVAFESGKWNLSDDKILQIQKTYIHPSRRVMPFEFTETDNIKPNGAASIIIVHSGYENATEYVYRRSNFHCYVKSPH